MGSRGLHMWFEMPCVLMLMLVSSAHKFASLTWSCLHWASESPTWSTAPWDLEPSSWVMSAFLARGELLDALWKTSKRTCHYRRANFFPLLPHLLLSYGLHWVLGELLDCFWFILVSLEWWCFLPCLLQLYSRWCLPLLFWYFDDVPLIALPCYILASIMAKRVIALEQSNLSFGIEVAYRLLRLSSAIYVVFIVMACITRTFGLLC